MTRKITIIIEDCKDGNVVSRTVKTMEDDIQGENWHRYQNLVDNGRRLELLKKYDHGNVCCSLNKRLDDISNICCNTDVDVEYQRQKDKNMEELFDTFVRGSWSDEEIEKHLKAVEEKEKLAKEIEGLLEEGAEFCSECFKLSKNCGWYMDDNLVKHILCRECLQKRNDDLRP